MFVKGKIDNNNNTNKRKKAALTSWVWSRVFERCGLGEVGLRALDAVERGRERTDWAGHLLIVQEREGIVWNPHIAQGQCSPGAAEAARGGNPERCC